MEGVSGGPGRDHPDRCCCWAAVWRLYLGFDEMKDTWKKDEPAASPVPPDEMEKYKSEISDLKKELEGLKAERKSE